MKYPGQIRPNKGIDEKSDPHIDQGRIDHSPGAFEDEEYRHDPQDLVIPGQRAHKRKSYYRDPVITSQNIADDSYHGTNQKDIELSKGPSLFCLPRGMNEKYQD